MVMVIAPDKTIFVVEDHDSMREAIERLLDAAGFTTSSFASAEALLAAGSVEDALCIISDIKLPAMSGLQMLTALRARGTRPPVIVITAHDAPGVREDPERHGAAAYLAKPFQGNVLLAAIA